MMKKIFVLFIGFISGFISAQNSEKLFTEGNEFYTNEEYNKAINSYKTILDNGEISSDLYYNIGNCYYKLKEIAPTIYNYEKALQLNPDNAKAYNNLVIAKRLTVDKFEPLPKSFGAQLDEDILNKFSLNTWGFIAVILSIVSTILFLLFYFSFTPIKKRLFFTGSVLFFATLVFSLFFGYQKYDLTKNTKFAIIFKEMIVQNEPVENSKDGFKIHEGTKVKIIDYLENWKNIELENGQSGWVTNVNLREL